MSLLDRIKHITPFSPRTIHIVELDTSGEVYTARYIRLEKSYGKVKLSYEDLVWKNLDQTLEDLKRKPQIPFFSNYPVVLCLTGTQVITRKLKKIEEQDNNILLQKVLPGAKPDDFILDTFSQDDTELVSVIKRSTALEIVKSFAAASIKIVEISLGPGRLLMLSENVPSTKRIFIAGKYKYDLNELSIQTTQEKEDNLHVDMDGMKISFANMLALSVGLAYFNGLTKVGEQIGEIKENTKEVLFGIYQNALLRFFFLAIIFLISTSYFLNKNYQESLIELQDATAEQNNSYELFQIKQTAFNNKLGLLNATGVITSQKLYKICDRIGMLTPSSIQLLTMDIFPLKKKIKKDKMIEFDKARMIVEGVSPSSSVLNQWVEDLNGEDWVNEVYINNFSTTDKQHPGKFELIINI